MTGVNFTLLVICLKLSTVLSAPILQLFNPYPRFAMPPSQQALQQQLLELQTMQELSPMAQYGMNQLRPLIILVPGQFPQNLETKDRNEDETKNNKTNTKVNNEDEDLNSIAVDAEPIPILEEQKPYLVVPNGRLSIGGIISNIPFLPIEINVPDTIFWAYNGIINGISGIIAIIGSKLPYPRPTVEAAMKNVNLKSTFSEMQLKSNIKPFVIMPLDGFYGPILPLL